MKMFIMDVLTTTGKKCLGNHFYPEVIAENETMARQKVFEIKRRYNETEVSKAVGVKKEAECYFVVEGFDPDGAYGPTIFLTRRSAEICYRKMMRKIKGNLYRVKTKKYTSNLFGGEEIRWVKEEKRIASATIVAKVFHDFL